MLIKPTLKFLKPKANIGLDEMPLLSLVLNIEFSVSGTIANPRPLGVMLQRHHTFNSVLVFTVCTLFNINS